MGRKRKKPAAGKNAGKGAPFCYYCGRGFPDEKVLIQHQKARHFKCEKCYKKMMSAHALMNHMYQVHKETLTKVHNAKEGRESVELAIFGMAGVPQEAIEDRAKRAAAKGAASDDSDDSEDEGDDDSSDDDAKGIDLTKEPTVSVPQQVQAPAAPAYPMKYQGMQYPGQQQQYPGMPNMMPPMRPMMGQMMGYFHPHHPHMGMPMMPGMDPYAQQYNPNPNLYQPQRPPVAPGHTPNDSREEYAGGHTGPVEGEESDKKGGPTTKVLFVYKDVLSMEEKRALHPRYRVK